MDNFLDGLLDKEPDRYLNGNKVLRWYNERERAMVINGRVFKDTDVYHAHRKLWDMFVDLILEERYNSERQAIALRCRLGHFKVKGKPSNRMGGYNVSAERYRRQ